MCLTWWIMVSCQTLGEACLTSPLCSQPLDNDKYLTAATWSICNSMSWQMALLPLLALMSGKKRQNAKSCAIVNAKIKAMPNLTQFYCHAWNNSSMVVSSNPHVWSAWGWNPKLIQWSSAAARIMELACLLLLLHTPQALSLSRGFSNAMEDALWSSTGGGKELKRPKESVEVLEQWFCHMFMNYNSHQPWPLATGLELE